MQNLVKIEEQYVIRWRWLDAQESSVYPAVVLLKGHQGD
jgi:hypothetical protein